MHMRVSLANNFELNAEWLGFSCNAWKHDPSVSPDQTPISRFCMRTVTLSFFLFRAKDAQESQSDRADERYIANTQNSKECPVRKSRVTFLDETRTNNLHALVTLSGKKALKADPIRSRRLMMWLLESWRSARFVSRSAHKIILYIVRCVSVCQCRGQVCQQKDQLCLNLPPLPSRGIPTVQASSGFVPNNVGCMHRPVPGFHLLLHRCLAFKLGLIHLPSHHWRSGFKWTQLAKISRNVRDHLDF